MVSIEFSIDSLGAVRGGQQAVSALNNITNAARFALAEMSSVGGAFGNLGGILAKAQPWLVAATTLLSGLAAGMALMSRNTSEAARGWGSLASSVREADSSIKSANFLGIATSPYLQDKQKAQFNALRRAFSNEVPMTVNEVAAITGNREELLSSMAQAGVPQAREYRERGMMGHVMPGEIIVDPDMQQRFFREYYNRIGNEAALARVREDRSLSNVYQFGAESQGFPWNPIRDDRPYRADYVSQSYSDQQRVQSEAEAQRKRDMQETLQIAREIGGALSDAAWDFASGMRSGRDVALSIINELGRGLMRSAMTSLTNDIITSFKSK